MTTDFKKKFKNLFFRFYFFVLRIVGFITKKHFALIQFDVTKPDFISREIAKNIRISKDWLNFPLEPPLEIRKSTQHLRIHIESYNKYAEFEEYAKGFREMDFTKIIPADGTIINPQAQIIDENRVNYELKLIWTPYAVVFINQLPNDRKYVELRICSDKSFRAYKIDFLDITEETPQK